MSRDFSHQEIAIKNEKIEEQNESEGSATLDYNNCQDVEVSQDFFDIVKEETLMLDTKCIAVFQDAESNKSLEKTGETGYENLSQPKNLDIEQNDSEDIPLSWLRQKPCSDKVENEAIKTIETENDTATDVQTNQSSKSYDCNKCNLIFKIKTDFTNHMRWVHRSRKQRDNRTGEGRFKCKLCKNVYHTRPGLRHHERSIHNINKKNTNHVCKTCDKSFLTKQRLRSHELVHTKKRNYACSLCSKEFIRQVTLRTHVKRHTRNGNYYCVKCKKVFQDREEFRTHFRNHITVKPKAQCNICGQIFKKREYLKRHTILHQETQYKCTECGKDCKSERDLTNHTRMHTGEKPFKCETCGKTFRIKPAYQKHLRVHEAISYPCPHCDKKYKTKQFLNSHIDVHKHENVESKFECDKCHKIFKTPERLKRHVKTHNGPKYKCDQCEKEFVNIYNLRNHIHLHNAEKPFECETCGKRFHLMPNYKQHLLVHTDLAYSCDKCGKLYRSKKSLAVHANEKSCKKKYPKKYRTQKRSCAQCGESFKSEYSLHKHIYGYHSGDKPFRCEPCYVAFDTEDKYRMHTDYCKSQRPPPAESTIKLENEDHVDTELPEQIKIETTREELDSFCETTDRYVIHLYKPKDLEDNTYFEITDVIESGNC